MLVGPDGVNAWGWVGGGCAERHVCEESLFVISTGVPRILQVDLEEEVFGVGMPCGGSMEVFIDPVLPARRLCLADDHPLQVALAALAQRSDWQVEKTATDQAPQLDGVTLTDFPPPEAQKTEATAAAIHWLAQRLASERGRSGKSLRRVKNMANALLPPPPVGLGRPCLLLLGHHRVNEELAWLGTFLGWHVCLCAPPGAAASYPAEIERGHSRADLPHLNANTRAFVATQHRGDHTSLQRLLSAPLPYVGLMASARRTQLVLELADMPTAPAALHAPAGLDLGAITPFEIALSVMAEMLSLS